MAFIIFIVAFICGVIAGLVGSTLLAMHRANMTLAELSNVGRMMLIAGNNRTTTMTLQKGARIVDKITFIEN